jgi:hypothetical protein
LAGYEVTTQPDTATAGVLNQIGRPNTVREQLQELLNHMETFLHLETVAHILFVLGVAVSSRIETGDPLWGMVVGAASSGKTECIRMLDQVADEHPDELTAPSLLSWSKNKKTPRAVGLLTRIPNPGLLTVADFSTVLATSDRGGRDQLFALLRRAYDGMVSRDLGNSETALTWQGRLTLAAACTPIIDSYSSYSDALGPRWLYCRVPEQGLATKRASGRMALGTSVTATNRRRAVALADEIVRDARRNISVACDLAPAIEDEILDAAIVACTGRGTVERDGYGKREISALPVIEEPPRLTAQLGLLARSLLAIGLDNDEAIAICRRCALDSMPQARRRCLEVLAGSCELSVTEIARASGGSRTVARRALEDLQSLGLADGGDPEERDSGSVRQWSLAGENQDLVRQVVLNDLRAGAVPKSWNSLSLLSE